MTAYFDIDDADCLALLPIESRDATGLDRIAEAAEADIIAHYTRDLDHNQGSAAIWSWSESQQGRPTIDGFTPIGGSTVVYLKYYCVDAANVGASAQEQALKLAMRRTVALVIIWRLLQETMNTAAVQETRGGRHLIKEWWQREPFPAGWDRFLRPFDTRNNSTVL